MMTQLESISQSLDTSLLHEYKEIVAIKLAVMMPPPYPGPAPDLIPAPIPPPQVHVSETSEGAGLLAVVAWQPLTSRWATTSRRRSRMLISSCREKRSAVAVGDGVMSAGSGGSGGGDGVRGGGGARGAGPQEPPPKWGGQMPRAPALGGTAGGGIGGSAVPWRGTEPLWLWPGAVCCGCAAVAGGTRPAPPHRAAAGALDTWWSCHLRRPRCSHPLPCRCLWGT